MTDPARYTLGTTTHTLSEWATRSGIGRETLRQRLLAGMSLAEALATPVNTRHRARDLRGRRFGHLTVTGPVEIRRPLQPPWDKVSVRFWPCRCDCGATRTVKSVLLLQGKVRACATCSGPQRLPVGHEQLTLSEIAARLGICRSTLQHRLSQWGHNRAVTQPPQRASAITICGRAYNLTQWGQFLGITRERARQLHRAGKLSERVIAAVAEEYRQIARRAHR